MTDIRLQLRKELVAFRAMIEPDDAAVLIVVRGEIVKVVELERPEISELDRRLKLGLLLRARSVPVPARGPGSREGVAAQWLTGKVFFVGYL